MEQRIIQLTTGRGPLECQWVLARLFSIFQKALKAMAVDSEVIDRSVGQQPHTLQSVTLMAKGEKLSALLKDWEGSILWVGQSPYRKFHKRKNWFVEIRSFEYEGQSGFSEGEIEFKTTKASGPGGQHVNKTESAVWAKHVKTGVKVLVQDSRSQHQNRKIALERLRAAVALYEQEKLAVAESEQWKQKIQVQRGNPVRKFTGVKFKE